MKLGYFDVRINAYVIALFSCTICGANDVPFYQSAYEAWNNPYLPNVWEIIQRHRAAHGCKYQRP